MTDASLDVRTDSAICNDCGDDLIDISSYTKASMKMVGDIVRRKNRKAFTFSCEECGEMVEVSMVGAEIVGAECDKENYNCKFSITSNMINAIKIVKGEEQIEDDSE